MSVVVSILFWDNNIYIYIIQRDLLGAVVQYGVLGVISSTE
jgi:uncharacterized MnhB-related membrane protein